MDFGECIYPYQTEFLDNYYQPLRCINKARQTGISQAFAIEGLYAATTEAESTTLLVSRSQDLATNLLRYCYQCYNNLKQAPRLTKSNEGEMGFANGGRIKSIPANRSTGRGFAANRVYLDEFAYASYAEDIFQSVSPTVSQGGYLTVASTPNGIGNLFHTLSMDANYWRLTIPWYRCPAYNPSGFAHNDDAESKAIGEAGDWYKRERPKYTAQQWAAEYECDFVGSGTAVFQQVAIANAEQGATGEQPPQAGREYLTSVDIGRRHDATVINTFDVTEYPYQRVAHERLERLPYPTIQALIERRYRAYGGRLVIESNGTGDPVIENLSVQAEPFITTARTKQQAIETLVLLLEHGNLKAQWTEQERRELMFYQWDDRALVQDCVMSLAIGMASAEHREAEAGIYWIDI